MKRKRYLQDTIEQDAFRDHKIAFVSGPRQVGKTSLAQSLLQAESKGLEGYFTWDDDEFQRVWSKHPKPIFESHALVVLDEIHKDRIWKTRLKGLYDLYKERTRILVTGSARLDFYRKSGDSLQGRYYPYRLHPFSLNETERIPAPPKDEWEGSRETRQTFEDLLRFGGFPDPLFGQNEEKARRWRRLHRERMIKEDVRDLKEVKDLERLRTLSLLLEDSVGSPLSYQSLREDLKVSFDTVANWIELLEAVYFCYRVRPYSKNVKQAIRKEPKLFLFDWAMLRDEGARIENLVASHLLKSCQAWTDCAIGEYELHYVRDKQKREVDFLVTENGRPYVLVEVKSGKSALSPSLVHFTEALKPKFSFQLVRDPKHEKRKSIEHPDIHVIDIRRFLSRLV